MSFFTVPVEVKGACQDASSLQESRGRPSSSPPSELSLNVPAQITAMEGERLSKGIVQEHRIQKGVENRDAYVSIRKVAYESFTRIYAPNRSESTLREMTEQFVAKLTFDAPAGLAICRRLQSEFSWICTNALCFSKNFPQYKDIEKKGRSRLRAFQDAIKAHVYTRIYYPAEGKKVVKQRHIPFSQREFKDVLSSSLFFLSQELDHLSAKQKGFEEDFQEVLRDYNNLLLGVIGGRESISDLFIFVEDSLMVLESIKESLKIDCGHCEDSILSHRQMSENFNKMKSQNKNHIKARDFSGMAFTSLNGEVSYQNKGGGSRHTENPCTLVLGYFYSDCLKILESHQDYYSRFIFAVGRCQQTLEENRKTLQALVDVGEF